MRLCKYCNKPIAQKDIWNPDNDGNGYHHHCLVDMEFKARDKHIYDKGKMDVLEQIRAEIEVMMQNVRPFDGMDAVVYTRGFNDGIGSVVDVIDKYTAERR